MQWLLTAHSRRYHRHYGATGHVGQGRLKAFPVEDDGRFVTVLRDVEREAARNQRPPWSAPCDEPGGLSSSMRPFWIADRIEMSPLDGLSAVSNRSGSSFGDRFIRVDSGPVCGTVFMVSE
jgi:hypothetical protein